MVWGVQPYMRLLTRGLWLANNSLYVCLYINDILLDGQIFAVMVDKILSLKVFVNNYFEFEACFDYGIFNKPHETTRGTQE